MPGLFPSEREIFLLHLFHHVLVTDVRANQLDAEVPERDFETDIAHDGRNHRVAAQPALHTHLLRAHQHHVIAVEHASACVNKNRTVAVAVECHTEAISALRDNGGKFFGMRRSHTSIDVLTVRLGSKHRHIETELFEQRRSNRRHRAIRAIDSHADGAKLRKVWQH
jgi:hypothetical protein